MISKRNQLYRDALKVIPQATQTNAKKVNAEWPSMPSFIVRGDGCRIWDLDGKEYIDYRSALGPIILGYKHPDVEKAVKEQMENGILFSMASPLELETTRAVLGNVPWLEQIRFVKSGAEACSACVRLARAVTGREHILTGGYHGFHDWSVSGNVKGIPANIRDNTHPIAFGDLLAVEELFQKFGGKLAGVVIEPYEFDKEPDPKYLSLLREKCNEYRSILIFDEVLTGFRLAKGGAQEYFGITPDLAAYAKALANGYPLAAFGGKKRIMQTLDEAFITTTYGGETLSLAACNATMQLMQKHGVHKSIFEKGNLLIKGFREIVAETGAPLSVAGLPPAPDFIFSKDSTKLENKFYTGLFKHGIFPNHPWFINYSHTASDIEQTLDIVRKVLQEIC